MSARWTGFALAVAVGAAPAFADHAHPRGGGSSGGSSAGASHHSGGGSGGSYHPSGGGGSSHAGPSGGSTGAQYRHPRAGTGTGPRYYGHYGHYGYPYYGYGYYRPYSYGYWPYWGYGYWPYYDSGYYGYYGGPYSYGYGSDYSYGYHDESGALRTFVEPSETKIYVDGRYAGTADDFDGLMQRLYVSPGAHELLLSLEGYKSHRVKVYVSPGATLKLHFDMAKGSGEDAQIDTLGNPEDERWGQRDRRRDYDDENDDADRNEVRREDPRSSGQPDARDRSDNEKPTSGLTWGNELGTVRLAIQPGDASVYVDGRFKGPANGLRSLRLSPGKHRIEVVRPGFRTEEREVDVRDGEDTTLELELSRS